MASIAWKLPIVSVSSGRARWSRNGTDTPIVKSAFLDARVRPRRRCQRRRDGRLAPNVPTAALGKQRAVLAASDRAMRKPGEPLLWRELGFGGQPDRR